MNRFLPAFMSSLIVVIAVVCGHAEPPKNAPSEYLQHALLPKQETGATRFLDKHPDYDGRGVLVAIFDTGVDPGASGLSETTDGKPKIVDIIDATGDGDVAMSEPIKPSDGELKGPNGRKLKVGQKWKNPTGDYRVGSKAAYTLYPPELVERLKKERRAKWMERQREREAILLADIDAKESKVSQEERQARLTVLRDAMKNFDDPGPVLDCVTFHDGKVWRAAIDTDEDCDFNDEELLTDYKLEHKYATFDDASRLNFSVNIYDDGKLLSIVTVSGDHGTHVAGIVAANYRDRPARNGLAPGAQLMSVKIGDNRIDGMETGTALMRGLKRVADMKCDLINMSYGEATAIPDAGRLIEECNEIVREKGVIFVASAGNSGPALSTVGSPGGTSSAVIGVGAYVSPEMAEVEYSLRQAVPGLPYTWTSRGPTTDGDWGVDLFAPGGAVAPIPTYSLQPSRRMNGTSMASPNACGNIALMLSALKQKDKIYTPASILQSLQATAQRQESVDGMAQGPGLIQIDRAFEHQLQRSADDELVEIQVNVKNRNDARGIYLREREDLQRPIEAFIGLRPRFEDIDDNSIKLKYELPLLLRSNADWVSTGTHLLLTHDGASFDVSVDPTQLDPGVHVAEVTGVHADHPERGALFRLPVVVTKTTDLQEHQFRGTIQTQAGSLSRTFLTPPAGSRTAELKLKNVGKGDRSFCYVHTVQLLEGESFEDHETLSPVALSAGEEFVKKFPVVAGRTLEVCVAQYWSSLGQADLDLEVRFEGPSTTASELTFSHERRIIPVEISAPLDFTRCELSGSLSKWERSLLPLKAETKLLSTERNGLWDHQNSWQLVLSYEFELDADARIRLTNPPLTGLLYDAPVDSHRLMLFDDNEQLVWTEDMYPGDFPAKQGTYKAQVELRHLDREALSQYEKLPLVISQSIGSVGLNFYRNRTDAINGSNKEDKFELSKGEKRQLWASLPSRVALPANAANGDLLTGQVKLNSDDVNPIPMFYLVTEKPNPKQDENAPKPVTDLKQAEIDFLLESLATLNWEKHQEQIGQITERVKTLEPKNRKLLVTRLHLADNEDRKDHLPVVVKLADEVIRSIKQRTLILYYGQKHAPKTAEEKKLHGEMEATRKDLIDALYRKGRALAYMELPDVVEQHPVKDQSVLDEQFEKNFQQLSRWVDTTSEDYFLLHIRRDRRQGHFAVAIQLLNKHFDKERPEFLHNKKRRDLYELLGWSDWQDYEQHWMWRRFPERQESF